MSEKIRWDVRYGPPVDFGLSPPTVTVAGYPPKAGEGSRAYITRVQAEIMCEIYAPKPPLWKRLKGWLAPLLDPPQINREP